MATKRPALKKIPSTAKYDKLESNGYNPQPTLCIKETVLKEVKSWKVGQIYKLEIEVEMVGQRKDTYGSDKGQIEADFKVTKIGII